MNPNEEKLAQFVEDTVMYHAVKAIIFEQFDLNKHIPSQPNSERYEAVIACIEGQKRLQQAFYELDKFKKYPTYPQNNTNPAV